MFVVGLTGGIGSGKTTISNIFSELGINIVDTDRLARDVVMPDTLCLTEIRKRFGDAILLSNGELDRRKLRDIIFSNSVEKAWLEKLLHPAIRKLTRQKLSETKSPYAILSSPLLLESPDRHIVDRILIVDIPTEQQLRRTAERDSANKENIQKIVDSQMSREKRLALADDIIDNSAGFEYSRKQALNLHQSYLAKSNTQR